MKPRCAILDDYQNVALTIADWTSVAERVDVQPFNRHFASDDELVAAIGDCAIVVAMRERTPFPRPLLARLPKLELLVTTGMRNASIDVAAAADHGIVVCGTPTTGQPAAELTWALILALLRSLPQESAALRADGPWQSTIGNDLAGKRLGVIGLGKLGTRVAAVAKAFGVNVTAWSQNLTADRCVAAGVSFAGSLDALLESSDIVTLHVVLSARTQGLLGERELRLMKPTAVLINTSRGPLVDEPALIAALSAGTIAGVGLDVFDVEPLPAGHPFRRPGVSIGYAANALSTARGSLAIARKRALAGPAGRVRFCSQFCNVFTGTPISSANSRCESRVASRSARGSGSAISVMRAPRTGLPCTCAPISRTLEASL